METANHECYVSLEVAKLLKKAGFDWKVRYMYRNNNPTLCICTESPYRNVPKLNKSPMYWQYAAPTLEIAQKWLREEKNYEIFVVVKFLADKEYIARVETNISGYSTDIYKFYEEAQEAGIKKALEIILKK